MKELQRVFNYEDRVVRTVVEGETVWFVAKDVCDILEINNSRQALTRLDEDEKSSVIINDGSQNRSVSSVNETGLYELVFSSRKDEAKSFKKWVKKEVLPSIRKHGAYMTDDVLERSIQDPEYMIGVLTALKEERMKRLELEKTNNILMHVNRNYTATEIAKEMGFRSATSLNNDLAKRKIQFKQNGTWILYSRYADKGYVDIKQDVLDNGRVIYHRKFTQLGREWLLKLYGKEERVIS